MQLYMGSSFLSLDSDTSLKASSHFGCLPKNVEVNESTVFTTKQLSYSICGFLDN